METIALFGGSFDPPHIAHETIVKKVLTLNNIEKVIVMPTFLNPFKSQSFAPASLRLKWLKKIFSHYSNVEISDYEVTQGLKVPTIDTVNHLLKRYKKIYLIIGADNLRGLHLWHKYEQLKDLVTFIIVSRNDITIPKDFIYLEVHEDVSSSALRNRIDAQKLPKECEEEIIKVYKENN